MAAPSSSARRWLMLTFWALVCAVLSAIAAEFGLLWSLPPSDAAQGSSPFEFLINPFVLLMASMLVVPASLLGLAGARVFLWNTRLEVTVSLVTTASVLVCLVAGRLSFLVVVPALFAAFLAMVWCEERFPAAGSTPRKPRQLRAVRSR